LAVVLFDTKVNPKSKEGKSIWDRYAEILGLNKWNINETIEIF
jgi:hypothetical protein